MLNFKGENIGINIYFVNYFSFCEKITQRNLEYSKENMHFRNGTLL